MKNLFYILLLAPVCTLMGQDKNARFFTDSSSRSEKIEQQQKTAFVPGNSSFANSVTNIRITTTSDGTLGSINTGFLSVNKKGGIFSGNIEIASPVSKSGVARPATLDGLPSDGKATLGFEFKKWSKSPTTRDIIRALKPRGVESFMDLQTDSLKRVVLKELHLGHPWFIGFTLTGNKQDLEYARDETLLDIEEEEKYSYGGNLYAGVYTGLSLTTLFRLSISYQSFYKQNPKNEYLVGFNGGPNYMKRELAVGAPSKKSDTFVRLDMVKRFVIPLGINPSITYREEESDLVFDLPIYFAQQDKDGKLLSLNGGVYLNYVTSLDEPFSMGLFIGTSLDKILKINN